LEGSTVRPESRPVVVDPYGTTGKPDAEEESEEDDREPGVIGVVGGDED